MARADNFDVTQGAGKTIKAIDVGGAGVLVQASADVAFDEAGWTTYTMVSAGSTNATSVSTTPTVLHSIVVQNVNAAVRYIKLFDKASAPTVGTDTPVLNIGLQGSATGPSVSIVVNANFTLGLAFALVTGAALLNNSAVTASDVMLNLLYKAQ